MAVPNKRISNRFTGLDIVFLQTARDTAGAMLEMEATYHTGSREPVSHYHPRQTEDFTVIEGELQVKLDGVMRTLRPGETLHIAAGQRHSMWNSGTTPAVVIWRVQPAMDTEYLLETLTGLANAGKTDANGFPGILQVALTANAISDVMRIAAPPFPVQWTAFTLLRPLARLLGYKPTYPEYLD